MSKVFQVGIYSHTETLYEGGVIGLVAPVESGYLGVLANHAPLVAKLTAGKITLRLPAGESKEIASSSGGFLEVINNQATLLL
jgi:F-type H+-transporting ATPase subunit epsilon